MNELSLVSYSGVFDISKMKKGTLVCLLLLERDLHKLIRLVYMPSRLISI